MSYRLPYLVLFRLALAFVALGMGGYCYADFISEFDFFKATNIIEIRQGSELSNKMNAYSRGGYELANATPVSLQKWYTPSFSDIRISYITEVHQKLGVIWGFSTGEYAPKYTIDPSIKLGLLFRHEIDESSSISLRGTTIIAGRLRESACVADYGQIGGVQQVNCRLAASVLPPSQTLQYLHNEKPYNFNSVWVTYVKRFN